MNPCRGDREQACGGGWRIAIYQNPNFKPSTINLNQSNVNFAMNISLDFSKYFMMKNNIISFNSVLRQKDLC